MPVVTIDSLDDERIAPYRQLKANNLTRWSGLFVAEGDKLVVRLLESRFPVVSLLVVQSLAARYEGRLPSDTPLYVVPDDQVKTVVGFNFHRGVLACGRRLPGPDAAALAALPGLRRLIVLPEIHDAENLGSIIRTSAALGVDAVMLGPPCADPFSRRVQRTSMGAVFRLPIVESRDLASDLKHLQAGGFALWATVTDSAARPLYATRPPERMALLFGSEGHGLSDEIVQLCDQRITVPMAEGVDSFNVSVTAGIVLYQLCRRDRD